jgi:hypothetical protein
MPKPDGDYFGSGRERVRPVSTRELTLREEAEQARLLQRRLQDEFYSRHEHLRYRLDVPLSVAAWESGRDGLFCARCALERRA